MLTVGLTGGTGAGKSTVAGRLRELGALVVDADVLAREVVAPGSEGLAAVVAEFGPQVLAPDGAMDRAALAAVVFADPARRRALEAITHPRIGARTREIIAAAPADAVVVHDVPLLVEKRMGAGYHLVVVVDAAEQTRVDRLVRGRGMSADDAWARVRAQADAAQRAAAADVLLDNSGDPERLLAAVDVLWHERLVPFERNVRRRAPAPRAAVARLVAYDPTWPVQASRLVDRVRAAVGDRALGVEHVGSTAVPGLAAQDVLDLQLTVTSLRVADELRDVLDRAGFAFDRDLCWDDGPAGTAQGRLHRACDPARPVDLHVRAAGPAAEQTLTLRNRLRADAGERDAYAAVKAAAAGLPIDAYEEAKRAWIRAALARDGGT